MEKNPYLVLGINETTATLQDVEDAYARLKKKYESLIFTEGEVGREASQKLSDIEIAYHECREGISRRQNGKFNSLDEISDLIRNNDLEKAQRSLDNIMERGGEWHYLQAAIYLKRKWFTESKNHLEIACQIEPGNSKFKEALDDINKTINQDAFGSVNRGNEQNQQRAGYANPDSGSDRAVNDCCNICSCLICTDCCCELGGGDCIPCC